MPPQPPSRPYTLSGTGSKSDSTGSRSQKGMLERMINRDPGTNETTAYALPSRGGTSTSTSTTRKSTATSKAKISLIVLKLKGKTRSSTHTSCCSRARTCPWRSTTPVRAPRGGLASSTCPSISSRTPQQPTRNRSCRTRRAGKRNSGGRIPGAQPEFLFPALPSAAHSPEPLLERRGPASA